MRVLAAALLACLAAVPLAGASNLPVVVDVSPTLPSDSCGDCVGVDAGAGVGIPNCFDCPAFGASLSAQHEGDATTVGARVCYSSFFYICYVDEEVTV